MKKALLLALTAYLYVTSSFAVKTTNLLIFPVQGKIETRDTLTRGITMAKKNVYVVTPILNDANILSVLKSQAEKKVKVQILLTSQAQNRGALTLKHPYITSRALQKGAVSGLDNLGATYIIIDDKMLIVSGLPLKSETLKKDRGFGYIIHNKPIINEALRMFQLDWAQKPAQPKGGPVIWGPDNTRAQLLSHLKQANSTIHLLTPALLDEGLTLALCHLAKNGIKIKVLTPAFSGKRTSKQKTNATLLRSAGADLHYAKNASSSGTYICIDGSHLIVLSSPLGPKSLDMSREFGVISKSPISIAEFLKVFNTDWNQANPRVS